MDRSFVALLLVLLPGCFLARTAVNAPITPEHIARLEAGRTTQAEVLEILGAPADVVQLGKRSAWRLAGPYASPSSTIRRAAAAAMDAAEAAQRAAKDAGKDTVKGLRTVTKYEITDHRALLHWIAKNDKDAVYSFIEEWARKEHKACANADGLRVWAEKEAF